MNKKAYLIYPAIAVFAVAVDQWLKNQIETRFVMHQVVDLLPFLGIYRTHNTGIAFSMFDWLGGTWLIVMPVFVVGLVGWLAWRTPAAQWIARTGFALIIGGAIGNLIDRINLGYVVDYILFHVGDWSFAIFNFADACISVGAALVILQELINWRQGRS